MSDNMSNSLSKNYGTSILVGITLIILSVSISRLVEHREDENRLHKVEAEAVRVQHIVELDLQHRIKSLQRMVHRWEMNGGTHQNQFIADAEVYVQDAPGYQAIEWVDKQFYVRWIVPFEGNEKAQDLYLGFEENRRLALEQARNLKIPTLSSPIDLVQGGKGILIYFPIYLDTEFDGFILAVFRIDEWISNLLEENGNFLNQINIDNQLVFSSSGWKDNLDQWDRYSASDLYGHMFHFTIRPTNVFLAESHTPLPRVIGIIGVILSLLISITIILYRKSKNAVIMIQRSSEKLEHEIVMRKQIEGELESEKQRLSYILEGTNVGTWEWNIESGETVFNERWANMIGYTLEEISPVSIDTWMKYAHPDDLEGSEALLLKHFAGELDYYEFESRMKHKNGNWIWVLDRGKVATRTEDGKPLLMSGTHKDITKQKQNEERIQHLAQHDTLTDLPTLRLAKDRLTMALEIANRKNLLTSIFFIDLDGFKAVNDIYGHGAGDFVLQEISKRLTASTRKVDTVARIGGDEFLVILSELQSKESASVVAQKILRAVEKPITFEHSELLVSASIGISMYPGTSTTIQSLIKEADSAMYTIKDSGKNGYAFFEEVQNSIAKTSSL